MHAATGSRTSIDLSICDASLRLDLSWTVNDDLSGSDHYPVIIKNSKPEPYQSVPQWKLKKADWSSFQVLCEQHLNESSFTGLSDRMTHFTQQLIGTAQKTIPKTKPNSTRVNKPWFDDTCKEAIRTR